MTAAAPPFSAALLLGLALRPLPPRFVKGLSTPAVSRVRRRLSPLMADRLSGMSGTVAVLPTDFPYGLLLHIGGDGLDMEVTPCAPRPEATAHVQAPLEVLLALAQAEGDGDASFFSRDLVMEGDTSLVMALRYAMEAAAEDGAEPLALLAEALPLPDGLRRRLMGPLVQAGRAASEDVARVQAALLAPLNAWRARTDARLTALETQAPEEGRPRRPRRRVETAHVHS